MADIPVPSSAGAFEGTQSTVSEFAGPYVADMLGKSWALSEAPYQAYQGQLTAGFSPSQQNAFSGIANLVMPSEIGSAAGTASGMVGDFQDFGYTSPPMYQAGNISTGTWNPEQAQTYMNPYLQSALDPMMKEARRQAEISRLADAGRLTQAGAYGGSRQAIMESELNRNLMDKQNQMLTQGYNTAYDKAMQGFTSDQQRALQAQQIQEQARQAQGSQGLTAADAQARYGLAGLQGALNAAQTAGNLGQSGLQSQLNLLSEQARLGGLERAANQEAIAADYAQFQQERDYPYQQLQFMQSMLDGLPIAAREQAYGDPNVLGSVLQGASGLAALFDIFK